MRAELRSSSEPALFGTTTLFNVLVSTKSRYDTNTYTAHIRTSQSKVQANKATYQAGCQNRPGKWPYLINLIKKTVRL